MKHTDLKMSLLTNDAFLIEEVVTPFYQQPSYLYTEHGNNCNQQPDMCTVWKLKARCEVAGAVHMALSV